MGSPVAPKKSAQKLKDTIFLCCIVYCCSRTSTYIVAQHLVIMLRIYVVEKKTILTPKRVPQKRPLFSPLESPGFLPALMMLMFLCKQNCNMII